MKTLKEQVEYCLENKPKTRNSDKLLWESICYQFYYLGNKLPFNNLRDFHNFIMEAPSQDAVKRVRAQFNQEGKYWPTEKEVAIARGINERAWLIELGYAVRTPAEAQTKLDIKAPYRREY
jgi:hypothetical protein